MTKKYLSYGSWRNTTWTDHDKFPVAAVNYLRRVQSDPRTSYMKNYTISIFEWTPEAEHIRQIPEEEWASYMEKAK